jgi:hypothetical protein
VKAFLNDLRDAIWPKRWLRVGGLESGTMVLMSMHRTSADALLAINDPMSEHVMHVDDAFVSGV